MYEYDQRPLIFDRESIYAFLSKSLFPEKFQIFWRLVQRRGCPNSLVLYFLQAISAEASLHWELVNSFFNDFFKYSICDKMSGTKFKLNQKLFKRWLSEKIYI